MMEITAVVTEKHLAAPTLKKGKDSNFILNFILTCKTMLFRDYLLHTFTCVIVTNK